MVKIQIFSLTKLGRDATRNSSNGSDELRVLNFLRDNKTATDSELEVAGGERWLLRRLKSQGLIKELTT